MFLVDVIKNPEYRSLLVQIEQDSYADSDHRNCKNYHNLTQTIVDMGFISYELLLSDSGEEVIAGSGLQKYTDSLGRVASRTYIMKAHRKSSGASLPVCESIFVPYEIQVATDHNMKSVFFSIELYRRRNAIHRFCKNLSKIGVEFMVHPQMVNTCRKYRSGSEMVINDVQPCWQNAAFHAICDNQYDMELPTMDLDAYRDRFYVDEKSRLC